MLNMEFTYILNVIITVIMYTNNYLTIPNTKNNLILINTSIYMKEYASDQSRILVADLS